MVGAALQSVSVPVAVAAGSGAGLSAYLSWRVFRDSPLGRVIGALAAVMAVVTAYHAVLVVGSNSTTLALVGGAKYVALVGVLGMLVGLQRRTAIPLREYDPSLLLAVVGTGAFVGGGVVAEIVAPAAVHWVHAVGALAILVGLCRLTIRDAAHDHWFATLVADPRRVRSRPAWMNPIDERILEVCAASELVLTPTIIAYNIEYSRAEVNRRLSELERRSLVERVERGKYRITPTGREYLYSPDGVVESESTA